MAVNKRRQQLRDAGIVTVRKRTYKKPSKPPAVVDESFAPNNPGLANLVFRQIVNGVRTDIAIITRLRCKRDELDQAIAVLRLERRWIAIDTHGENRFYRVDLTRATVDPKAVLYG